MRGEIGGEDQGSEGGDGENVKGRTNRSPLFIAVTVMVRSDILKVMKMFTESSGI